MGFCYALPVTLRRPKFVFDTQVISYLSDGTIPRVEWDAVRKFMSTRARYAISSITMYELLAGIEGGDEAHFRENQRRIMVLCEPANRKFLPLPGDFVRSAVFGLAPRNQAFQPQKLKLWTDVVLSAQTKDKLAGGRVTLSRRGHTDKSYGFSLSLSVSGDEMNQGIGQVVEKLSIEPVGTMHREFIALGLRQLVASEFIAPCRI